MLLVYVFAPVLIFLALMVFGIMLFPLLGLIGLLFAAGALVTRSQY